MHPESDRDEAGRANVHRGGAGPVADAGHLDGMGAVDGAGGRAHHEIGEGSADSDEVEQYGDYECVRVRHADDVASVELCKSSIQLRGLKREKMRGGIRTRNPSEAHVFKTNATLTITTGHGDNASGP